jgi:hypothetical protein
MVGMSYTKLKIKNSKENQRHWVYHMPSSSDPKLPKLRNSKLNPLNIAHCTYFVRGLAYLNVPTPTNPSRKAGNKQGLKSKRVLMI